MYIPFQDATSLPTAVNNDVAYSVDNKSVPGISASSARGKDGKIYVALVNTNPRLASDVSIDLKGQAASSATGQVLTAEAMDAHNTFDKPQAIKPAPYSAKAVNGKLTLKVPAKSVVVVAVEA
jgi:alpha-N-arabinofuranosidase